MENVNITSLISAFRAEIEKNSISPENVGYLMQLIYDHSSSMGDDLSQELQSHKDSTHSSLTALSDQVDYLASLAGGGVVEFWAVESFEDTVQDKTDKSADDEGCFVVYSPVHKAFFLRVPTGFTALYYKTWNGSSQWNRWLDSAGAYRPRANKLYVCVSEDGALYWWNSSELLQLGIRSEELAVIQEQIRQLAVRSEQLGVRSEQIETELQNLTTQVTDVEDIISNLATINGKSLLDGGDIVITGDGVMIEPIPEEDIKNLGDY